MLHGTIDPSSSRLRLGGHVGANGTILMLWGILALAPAVPVAETATALEMSADGEIQVATDGTVSDYRLRSELPPMVADLVDKDVRGWRFEPVVVEGTPVVAKTAMHLALKAEPAGEHDSYRIKIVNVIFGAPRHHDRIKQPHYPEQAVRAHVGAKVLLAMRLGENGRVTDVQTYQTSLDARASSENDAEHWRKMFEEASVTAAHSWTYDLSETFNGKTIETNVIVPVVFSLLNVPGSAPQPGQWKAYVPGPVHPAPWMTDRAFADRDLSTLPDGQSIPLDSRFHLKNDVIGKVL
jgi:hypothetical protein